MSQFGNAASHRHADLDRVAEPPAADHVAALLVIRIGVEQIVGHVLQDLLQPRARHFLPIHLWIGDGGRVVDVFHRDRRTRQHARPPAKPGRKRDLGIALFQEGAADQVVEGAGKIAAPVERRLRAADLARKLRGERRARLRDCCAHLGIGRDRVGEQRDELVAEIRHGAALHVEIEPRKEFPVTA